MTPIERRVTPWIPLWWEDPKREAVRIWQEFDGRRWFQMHEWRYRDGTMWAEGWIDGVQGWSREARPAIEPAPGDPPVLTAEELRYLFDRLDGVNDPAGQSARQKIGELLRRPAGLTSLPI